MPEIKNTKEELRSGIDHLDWLNAQPLWLADFSDEEVSFLLREAMQAGLKELSMILVAERTRRRNQKNSKQYNL